MRLGAELCSMLGRAILKLCTYTNSGANWQCGKFLSITRHSLSQVQARYSLDEGHQTLRRSCWMIH